MNQAQKRALELLHARQDERRRIATALHRGVSQTLAGLRIQLDLCESQLQSDAQHGQRRLSELRSLVDQSLTELQELITSLQPAIPEDVGLPAALRALVSFVCISTGKDIRLHIDEPFPALLWPIESTLYQTTKDILSLAAEPSVVVTPLSLRLEIYPAVLQLRIQGWERGNQDSLPGESVVLSRIREQAEAIGGSCVVPSREDGDLLAAVVMTLPLLLRDSEEIT